MITKLPFLVLGIMGLGLMFCLPHSIQGGDTAELVNAGYHLYVPHPPGYPLFTWLQFVWTHIFQVSTVFFRASFLTLMFGLTSLLILVRVSKNVWVSIILLLFLGLNPPFLESSLLPDVFSLHALIVSLIGYFYLFEESNKRKRNFWTCVLFFIGLANHHTSIFLLPCVLHVFFRSSADERKWCIYGSLVGLVLAGSLYLSLFVMHPQDYFSWGNITDFPSLLNHILRKDYGTFQLAPTGNSQFGESFYFLLKMIGGSFPLVLYSCYLVWQRKKSTAQDERLLTWSSVLLISMAFFLLMNVKPEMAGKEILIRFVVMPLTVSALWLAYILKGVQFSKKEFLICALLLGPIFYTFGSNLRSYANLRNDTVIEDYSRNFYFSSLRLAPAIIDLNSDSTIFGVRYIQAFEGQADDGLGVITTSLFFHEWFGRKIEGRVPAFKLHRKKEIAENNYIHLDNDLLSPNIDRIKYITNRGFKDGVKYKVTFLPLGRYLSPGSGVEFDDFKPKKFRLRTVPSLDEGIQSFTKARIYYEYSHFFLASGASSIKHGDLKSAIKNWKLAIDVVPFCLPAMINICETDPNSSICNQKVFDELGLKTQGFY